ncbi:MAG: hypothetical protein L6R40_005062 [Gallowayella cf. fulva]|nr:MAG: hypothetical protein L6R40_005062 [Xanthomendoza cf. fulva]
MAAPGSDQALLHLKNLYSNILSLDLSRLFVPTLVVSVIFPFCRFVHRDYSNFLALGPGGTPSNFFGYLCISYLRLFTLKDPFTPPPPTTQTDRPAHGFLLQLPKRPQPRPSVAGVAPHRQTNQKPPASLYQMMRTALYDLVSNNSKLLRSGNSCFEKHGLALFLCLCPQCPDAQCHTELLHPGPTHMNSTCEDTGEICHIHPSDSSMHLTLHPSDAALVISKGWGERHPLAGCLVFPLGKRLLPEGFVMVYAPQDESQVGVLKEIVRAAGWWVGGVVLASDSRNESVSKKTVDG